MKDVELSLLSSMEGPGIAGILFLTPAPGSYFSCCCIRNHENMDIICKEELLQAFQNAGCIPVCPLSMLKVSKLSCQRSLLGSLLRRSSWKDVIMLRSLVGHPVWKRPFLLTRSRAFVRSMNIILSGCLCFIHFCCSWRERIMSVVARGADLCFYLSVLTMLGH